jgi:hypothetical protein
LPYRPAIVPLRRTRFYVENQPMKTLMLLAALNISVRALGEMC